MEVQLLEPQTFYIQQLDGSSALELKIQPLALEFALGLTAFAVCIETHICAPERTIDWRRSIEENSDDSHEL
jgi:hypothetical protein